jgi:soluble cytochrome b562
MNVKHATVLIGLVVLVAFATAGSAAEQSDRENMRRVGAAYLSVRDDIAGKNLESARTKIADLVDGAKAVQLYWTMRNVDWVVDDGVKWSREALDGALTVKSALNGGNVDEAAKALQTTVQGCNACHQKYRPGRRTAQPPR